MEDVWVIHIRFRANALHYCYSVKILNNSNETLIKTCRNLICINYNNKIRAETADEFIKYTKFI